VPELQRLRADHAPAVLAFELANRAHFATFVSDRGDAFFDQFTERYTALLAEQEAGICIFHVLVGEHAAFTPDGVRFRGAGGRQDQPGCPLAAELGQLSRSTS
jgi:hypothetical protein